jgi:putative Mg2+ transporter-C (MgtC) family protein
MNPIDAIGIKALALRLSVAALVGAAIGLNRELHDKPAGLRTHALVTLGAAIAMTMTLQPQGAGAVPDSGAIGRVIQGVLTGIGFLGAGVILRDMSGHVTGLTTAATIWVCAAIGMLCGLGYWSVVVISLLLVFAVLVLGHIVEHIAERVYKRVLKKPPDHME